MEEEGSVEKRRKKEPIIGKFYTIWSEKIAIGWKMGWTGRTRRKDRMDADHGKSNSLKV